MLPTCTNHEDANVYPTRCAGWRGRAHDSSAYTDAAGADDDAGTDSNDDTGADTDPDAGADADTGADATDRGADADPGADDFLPHRCGRSLVCGVP